MTLVVRLRTRCFVCLGALLAAALAGCGQPDSEVRAGGTVKGDTLTVVSLLGLSGPDAPAARQILLGEKVALADAGGRAGAYSINFRSIDEGGGDPAQVRADAAAAARAVLGESQAIAVIGSLRYESASVSVPLLNAAGLLHVLPVASYPGFFLPLSPGEPERWMPSGQRNYAALGSGDDHEAETMLDAVAASAAGASVRRIVVVREPGADDRALADAVERAVAQRGLELETNPRRADAVVYAGSDPDAAERVLTGLARRAPRARLAGGDGLARTNLIQRLAPGVAKRLVLVSRAPAPGSSRLVRAIDASFRRRLGAPPEPYAYLGYMAMREVLAAGVGPAGVRANERRVVIGTYLRQARPRPTWSSVTVRDGRARFEPL